MDACVIFQIPVDSRGDVHPGVSSNHDLLALLVEFEEVLLALYEFGLKLCRSALVDTLQQFIHRISPHFQRNKDH